MSNRAHHADLVIGVDIGGTFTDCTILSEAATTTVVTKVSTTPQNPAIGFFNVIDVAAAHLGLSTTDLLARVSRVVHGTTHGTNAIVSRRGVRVGLIATAGHGDAMSVMRGGGRTAGLSPELLLHTPSTGKPTPFVPRDMVAEVNERIDCEGDIVVRLDENSVCAGVVRQIGRAHV